MESVTLFFESSVATSHTLMGEIQSRFSRLARRKAAKQAPESLLGVPSSNQIHTWVSRRSGASAG